MFAKGRSAQPIECRIHQIAFIVHVQRTRIILVDMCMCVQSGTARMYCTGISRSSVLLHIKHAQHLCVIASAAAHCAHQAATRAQMSRERERERASKTGRELAAIKVICMKNDR